MKSLRRGWDVRHQDTREEGKEVPHLRAEPTGGVFTPNRQNRMLILIIIQRRMENLNHIWNHKPALVDHHFPY